MDVVRTVRPQPVVLMRKGVQSRARLAVVTGSARCRIDATRTDSVFVGPVWAASSATDVSLATGDFRGSDRAIRDVFVSILHYKIK